MSTSPEPALPFDTAQPPRPSLRAAVGALGGRALFWAPVWVPLVMLAQVALLGLGPALAEGRRLDRAELELNSRLEREVSEGQRLERQLRAQDDPIFLERERRLLQQPDNPLRPK